MKQLKPYSHKNHKVAWWYDPIYKHSFHLIWNVNLDQLNSYLKGHGLEHALQQGDTFDGKCIFFPQAFMLIAFRKWSRNAQSIETLTHEAFHATTLLLAHRGLLPANSDNDEAHAYHLSYTVRNLLACLQY